MEKTKPRGFAAMDPTRRLECAKAGGEKLATNVEHMKKIGSKGGRTHTKEWMSRIGARGGRTAAKNRQLAPA